MQLWCHVVVHRFVMNVNTFFFISVFLIWKKSIYYLSILGIRNALLESEENECPDCHGKEISPETLIPNRYLRNAVNGFKDKTGYSKRIEAAKEKITQSKEPQVSIPKINIQPPKEGKLNVINFIPFSKVEFFLYHTFHFFYFLNLLFIQFSNSTF